MKRGSLLLALCMLAWPLSASAITESDLLDPDQAFRLSTSMVDSHTVRAQWDIADGYYLYRHRFQLKSATPGISLGAPQFPPGKAKKDEFFGEVQTYRHQVAIDIPVQRDASAPANLELTAQYQGCADAGVCYPPQTKEVSLTLPAAPAPDQSAPNEPAPNQPSAVTESPEFPQSPAPQSSPASPAAPSGGLSALSQLSKSLGLSSNQSEFLEPDQAYVFSADVADPSTLVVRWQIADGYYLYRERMKLKLQETGGGTGGAQLGAVQLPAGESKQDEFLGRTQVYHRQVAVKVPVQRTIQGALPVKLDVTYQGCAEAGLCYPPMTKTVALTLPAAAAGSATATPLEEKSAPALSSASFNANGDSAEPVAEQDRLARSLASGSRWLVLSQFFLLGVLLAFTPCVFPMLPILSSIIAGEGYALTMSRAFVLSLVYVLAMAVTYTGAGVVAGMFGQNLQSALQNPWIIGAFSLVFVLLALSMFGFYDLQLPSRWQTRLTEISNRQRGGTLLGVAVMGFLSALIVGPCVAPPLAGALIYIGQTGNAVLGGMALFALSLGMGTPLVVVGTTEGKFLPRSGPWMRRIKDVFGVLLLGLAIWMLERVLPAQVTMLLWAALLIVSGVYLGALEASGHEIGWRRLWKGVGIILIVYGIVVILGVASGGKDVLQPLQGLGIADKSSPGAGPLQFKRIKSVSDVQRELEAARAQNKPVVLDFYAGWCIECKRMEKYTFSDPSVAQALAGAVLLQADVTANDQADTQLLQHYHLIGPPATLFFGRNGQERDQYRLVGYMSPEKFRALVEKAFF